MKEYDLLSLNASQSHIWRECTHMPILKALVDPPYQTSEAAKRGKELHHLLSLAVMKRPWHTDELSEEYVTFVENGLKLVRPIFKNMNFVSEKLVEFCYGNLYCPRIRADLAGISEGRTRLMVADWKSGDRITKVEGNTQLQLYAFGFWKRLPKRHTIRKVYCYIVQPQRAVHREDSIYNCGIVARG